MTCGSSFFYFVIQFSVVFCQLSCYNKCNFYIAVGTVKSDELKWLPGGSEFILSTDKSTSDSSVKTKTYTSFTCSQDSLPEFFDNPIAPKHDDIILAKLGPGQVCLVAVVYLFRSIKLREGPICIFIC